ncbi:MAG: ParB/RepB/Spo0J family partition protein [Candidatus Korarchaeota archaeon]|nr:ParB/RepB/Spo0J family partition protein [Thermoproteota archaeon]
MSGWSETPRLVWVRVDLVKIPEIRLHSRFTEEEEKAFAESINLDGILEPIHVFEDENGDYWLADGQNRLETVKSQGKPIIPAYVMMGSKQDAITYSAKLNVLRGKVNVGELAELVSYLYKNGFKVEELATALHFSKGYISQLLTIAENPEILEKLKKGLISKEEAYKSAKSLLSKQVSQETIHEEKPSEKSLVTKQESEETGESLPSQQTPPEVEHEGVTDEELGITKGPKEAMETSKRSIPSDKKERVERCAFCGGLITSEELGVIFVHKKGCKQRIWDLIVQEAERETRPESSQP